MIEVPKPKNYGSHDVESFDEYQKRLPGEFKAVPKVIVESWIYRHWREFQEWLPLRPLEWKYTLVSMPSAEIMRISHVSDWPGTLQFWGDDLFVGSCRKDTWLGKFMLGHGTTPLPMIVAIDAGHVGHPRERGLPMKTPYQIIEGHMRLAYLQSMIRRKHETLASTHDVFVAEIPSKMRLQS